jgi:4-amino-4-deoxy-L-arabinose transferase-like glycosyltransferase
MILRRFDDIADSFIVTASRKPWVLYGVVLLICAALFLSGLFDMPPMDRDETRFAQATKQMLETQNYIDIHLGDAVRYKKPVGIYWLQAISVGLFGSEDVYNQIGYYRIPSAVGALIAILATIAMTRRLFGREASVFAGLLAPIPMLVAIEAHLAKTDSVLVACTALSLYVLACLWRLDAVNSHFKFKIRHFLIFWLALSVGILVKGVNVFVILSAIITLSIVKKDIKWLYPLKAHYGLMIVASVVLPWFLMIQHISGGQFLQDSAQGDLLSKILSGVENHAAPPFSYMLTHFGVFWPLSLISPFAVIIMWQNRKINDGYAFVLASVIPVWIMFELTPTKLPHYTYPLYSLLIVGISGACIQLVHGNYDILKGKLFFLVAFIYVLVSLIIAVIVPFILPLFDGITILLSFISVIIAIITIIKLRRGLLHGVVVLLVLQTLIILPNMFGRVMPQLKELNLASRMNDAVENSGCSRNAVFVSGYNEPSVMFKIGTQVHLISTDEAIERFKTATPCSLFFIGSEAKLYGHSKFNDTYPTVKPISTLEGFQINGGNNIIINLYKR